MAINILWKTKNTAIPNNGTNLYELIWKISKENGDVLNASWSKFRTPFGLKKCRTSFRKRYRMKIPFLFISLLIINTHLCITYRLVKLIKMQKY